MKTALLVLFAIMQIGLGVALCWLILSFIFRMWCDQYRRLRDRKRPE